MKVRINILGLPTLFQGYRIVHISDIHYGQWISADRLKGVVGLINQQEPDIVAIILAIFGAIASTIGGFIGGLLAR